MQINPNHPATPTIVESSPLASIEKTILQKLSKINELRYVGDDYGQLDYYESAPPVAFPCALIDISEVQYTNRGQNQQKHPQNRQDGTCVLSILVADVRLQNSTTQRSTSNSQQLNTKEYVQLVHHALHGWAASEQASKLQRIKQSRQRRNDGVTVYELAYTFAIYDI